MTTRTRTMPYRRLRVAVGTLLALTFVLALVGIYRDGPLSAVGIWPFLAATVALAAVTVTSNRGR